MDKIYLILGYGVPKDIFQDFEYRAYLAAAFNRIFEDARSSKEGSICVIFSGGRTDMFKPYRRSEAGEMRRYFDFLAKRECVKSDARKWQLIAEAAALSSMENLINSKKLIETKELKGRHITIFCEYTRRNRIRKLARLIFGPGYGIEVFPVDFSISANRYLPADYIRNKERKAIDFDLWALKNEENFGKYHRNFIEKFNFLRSYGSDRKQEAIRAWWENGGDEAAKKS